MLEPLQPGSDSSYSKKLDGPANERSIVELWQVGLLTTQARYTAIQILRGSRHWWRMVDRSLLFVGSSLVLAGVVFFFAYNWSRMNAIAKFGLIEAGLFLCALVAFILGLERLTGKVLLLAASVLVGVLLAVYGQVYQTGADAYENFFVWALLILPWVIVGRSHSLWLLWLVVTNVAMLTFWFQVVPPRGFDFELGIFLILGIWNGIALAVREYSDRAELVWMGGLWSRRLIWFAVLTYLSIPTIVLTSELEIGRGALAGAVGLVVALFVGHAYFQFRQPDLLCLGFNVLSTCIILLTFIGRLLFDAVDAGDQGAVFLIFGLIVLGMFSAAAFYLRMLSRRFGNVGN